MMRFLAILALAGMLVAAGSVTAAEPQVSQETLNQMGVRAFQPITDAEGDAIRGLGRGGKSFRGLTAIQINKAKVDQRVLAKNVGGDAVAIAKGGKGLLGGGGDATSVAIGGAATGGNATGVVDIDQSNKIRGVRHGKAVQVNIAVVNQTVVGTNVGGDAAAIAAGGKGILGGGDATSVAVGGAATGGNAVGVVNITQSNSIRR